MRRNRLEDDRARRDLRAFADRDVAKDLRPRANQNPVADLRMAISELLASAAEGDVLENRDVVADDRCEADD